MENNFEILPYEIQMATKQSQSRYTDIMYYITKIVSTADYRRIYEPVVDVVIKLEFMM
jgi:hypothetical protein